MDAESKLQAKLELLRRKKQQASQKSGAPTTTTNKPLAQNLENQAHKRSISHQQIKSKLPSNPSAAREAAIKALKAAKQAAEQQKAKTDAPAADDKPNNNSSNNFQTKIKFIIPKREDPPLATSQQQQQQQQPSSNAAAAAAATFTRPFPPPPPQQHHEEPRNTTVEPPHQLPKRPKLSSVEVIEQHTTTTDRSTPALPPPTNITTNNDNSNTNHTLFVGDLPPNFTVPALTAFFQDQFGCSTTRVRVNNHLCHGFVTFASRQDAEAILQFVQQQPIWYGNSMLRIMWANQGTVSREGSHHEMDNGTGTGTAGINDSYNNNNPIMEHPRVREARAEASKMAVQINKTDLVAVNMGAPAPDRGLVCYDDL